MEPQNNNNTTEKIVVIGGGISGLTVAIEAAEVGYETILVEKDPYLGGRVARMNQYFPKLCAPNCGLEINYRRIKTNPRIKVIRCAELVSITGKEGNYEVTLKLIPDMVNDNCTSCGKCSEACPEERYDDFNYGLGKTKAIYQSGAMPFPMKYTIDPKACRGSECAKCVSVCSYNAIDLSKTAEEVKIKAGSVVMATGWKPYEAEKLENLGYGRYQNVITNVMMERLAASDGPTGGKIIRPSDGSEVKSIAFVQCAGSRDEKHLPYCSGVCCMASLKHITYMKERNADIKVYVFYIDIRSPGTLEDFYKRIQEYPNLSLVRGKVARIEEDQASKDLIVDVDDTTGGVKVKERVEMVVLATGMVPEVTGGEIDGLSRDGYGFVTSSVPGIYTTGCVKRPVDVSTSVQEATGVALKAIQSIAKGKKAYG